MMRTFAAALAALGLAVSCATSPTEFSVSQFTMSGDLTEDEWVGFSHEKIFLYSESSINALMLHIIPSNNREYELITIHYLPGVPSIIGKGFAESYAPSDAPNGLRSQSEILSGEQRIPWDIHPGDPNGIYRMEVHINGKQLRTLEFDVRDVPPTA
jgi:hypothetical protein